MKSLSHSTIEVSVKEYGTILHLLWKMFFSSQDIWFESTSISKLFAILDYISDLQLWDSNKTTTHAEKYNENLKMIQGKA